MFVTCSIAFSANSVKREIDVVLTMFNELWVDTSHKEKSMCKDEIKICTVVNIVLGKFDRL